ncbi:hypothetical protein Pint_04115 [Pistacia integerrima]|uniref:Uncharacterized protein n=1 Tax=Pistacia integerrima TaxID=434235 RepID=A0ACC0Z8L8_9ROSI|nr:hypothetical protein Pint_04115 [Pistacia integerrima]
MENRYGYFRQGSGVWKSFTDGDFEEEEVWAVIKERRDSSAPSSKVSQFINNSEFEPSFSVQRRLPSAARMVPKTSGNGSSTSGSSNSNSPAAVTKLQSAPVKIPDWTLKGRDLSKVRNAVLTRTGFLEE